MSWTGTDDPTLLFVDLDGPLLLTDTIAGIAVDILKDRALESAIAREGEPCLKNRLAECWTPNPAMLLINQDVLE